MISAEELIFSSEASSTRYLYYNGFNSINIFVEDAGKEYEYEDIFQRMLGEKFKISTIFAAGGKLALIQCFEEFGQVSSTDYRVKNIYIADGDFDRIINDSEMIIDKHFIYLEAYNIESYFIDETACLQFSKGRLRCSKKDAAQKISFETWLETIIGQAHKLFLCYCFVKKNYPSVESVGRSSYLFLDYRTGFEKKDGYQQYWDIVFKLDNDAQEQINTIQRKYIELYSNNHFNLICGKFLFDSLFSHVRNIVGSAINKDDFRWHLISNFDISKLQYVKDRVLSVLASTD